MHHVRLYQWETNSSSVHQIIISEGEYKIQKSVKFNVGKYEWGFDILRTIDDRLSYIITLLVVSSIDENEFKEWYDKLKNFLRLYNIEIDESSIYPYIYDENGNIRKAKEDINYDENIFGLDCSIDHESCDNIIKVRHMLNSTNDLFDFLFSGKSMVLIGNDNTGDIYDFDVDKEQRKFVW